ncbi:50S ribosomal protein L3 N(5)-glutamine methyltransferase [Thalassotalea eurytherma]|uniref:Ribosomal protein uL3 glutamine methyltransferase n=1 Tax=Thalassotalea eurytherma TaxID=1144278 RepID=A0ABQ6GZ68_9GAMM|nr:50S ribosomal protein L3 N(5)-glutamine methyltransferase [Thalassotalea eurytherma]GLX81248.1 50S ribosomal protein L3 glutamine methyltransferase [Thalassotalea eurytherma]
MTDQPIEQLSSELTTINDFVRFGASAFNQAGLYFGHGTDNAWDEAVFLTMFTLNLPDNLFSQVVSCKLTLQEKKELLALYQRRINEEIPAAYLTNQANFAGLPFYVDERVLVPRSPIGELILNKFNDQLSEGSKPSRILDLCTGSGCIAIACAYQFPEAEVDAVDLSIDALNVCQINIESHGLMEQVIPIQSDIFSGVEEQVYDLIVTNPPYVDQEDVDALPQEFLHEPEMGLGSGNDGLDITRKILAQAANHLSERGVLICEVGNSQVHVEAQYPEVDFDWITFEKGGHGVFRLTKSQLEQYSEIFKARA